MNLTGFLRLTWKEYRAVRGFWLAMIVLVAFFQCVSVILPTHSDIQMAYSLALGAPAFFALGCCGAAFAVEKEEGTFDFLRTAPIHAGQVLASKLGLAVVATVAMFAVLWPLATLISGARLGGGDWTPHGDWLHGMLGLWLLGAVEAIAWGTFFSLRGFRPLVAVCVAMLAATATTHLLAWSVTPPPFHAFELTPYLVAVPRRAIVAAAVLAIDIYMGLRWLDRSEIRTRGVLLPSPLVGEGLGMRGRRIEQVSVEKLIATPDRSGMIAHLFWQQWRQSRWLMALMTGVFLFVGTGTWVMATPSSFSVVFVGLVPALMGAMVFLADQERRRFRFFVEHNIPPRWVWLTRQVPWAALVAVSAVVVCVCAIGRFNLVRLTAAALSAADPLLRERFPDFDQFYSYVPPILLGFAVVAVSFASGQWVSMLVRSGIMAGFFAVLLAGVLSGWAVLMDALGVSYLWSVAPIPLVLLWATWLRAPDWISENTTWHARLKAAVVIIPALTLLVLVPLYRVYSVQWVGPGFDQANFLLSEITTDAKATGQFYRRANQLLGDSAVKNTVSPDGTPRRTALVGREFLDDNTEALDLILEAAARRECVFDDPRTATDRTIVGNEIIRLVITSGQLLQAGGQLDEALERYLAALKVVCDLTDHTSDMSLTTGQYRLEGVRLVFDHICQWASHDMQSPEQIRGAIEKLQAIENTILPVDDRLKSNYVVAQRYVFGDPTAWPALELDNRRQDPRHPPVMLWPKLMPWEMYHGQRVLNQMTARGLKCLDLMRKALAEGHGVADYLPTVPSWYSDDQLYMPYDWLDAQYGRQNEPYWLPSITPDLWSTAALDRAAARGLAEFEAFRRGTILILALEAYRCEHGQLPGSLDALVGAYLDELPLDPYSGNEFCYFRNGIPAVATPFAANELTQAGHGLRPIVAEQPCAWCTGPELRAVPIHGKFTVSRLKCDEIAYYYLRQQRRATPLRNHDAWQRGFFFPLPKERL